MRYILDEGDKRPFYLKLYEQVREDIIKGVYKYGEKLPSKRLVADETGVSTITVEHAYTLLAEEGYIEPRERSGYFVTFRSFDYYGTPSFTAKHLPRKANTEGGAFPFSVMSKAMRRVISEYGEALLEKSPNKGCTELRRALCDYLFRSRGIKACEEQLIIGSGAEYLYSLVVGILGRKRLYAIETPSYEKIEQVYLSAGIIYDRLPLSNDGISSDALASTQASILHISPYRSFPTGITASASKKHEYIRWASQGDRYIVEDDFESEFSLSRKSEETIFAMSESDNVIYINTFTKTVSPALRVGYMILPHKLLAEFDKKLGFLSCTVPSFEQYLLCELITSSDFERHINRTRRKLRKEKT